MVEKNQIFHIPPLYLGRVAGLPEDTGNYQFQLACVGLLPLPVHFSQLGRFRRGDAGLGEP